MNKYRQFLFKHYSFDESAKRLDLHYSFDDQLYFTEQYVFDFDFTPGFDSQALDRAFQTLFFMAGASYYKAYPGAEIIIQKGQLDQAGADFFANTYRNGLGEFYYINKLNPNPPLLFPTNTSDVKPAKSPHNSGLLIGVGGGKDSLVSIELLRNQPKVATWSLNHRNQLEPLVQKIGLPHFQVERQWDKQLLELNQQDALNGHIPISAIFSAVGVIVAILTGYQDVVVSNESSANEPNLVYQGVGINHQYSKSLDYEKAFQNYLGRNFGDSLHYYSFLRPLSEIHIAQLFARLGFDKYCDVFSSCNRAFTHDQHQMFWCGICSKCAFTFLALTPFVERAKLEKLWSKNLLLDQNLEPTYKQLLGIEGDKPLDCVGEIKESRAAMRLAQQQYPELAKYTFDLPADYDYMTLSPHSMPNDLFAILRSAL